MGKAIDLTNQQFGDLKVLERAGSINHFAAWKCRCECCGEEIIVRGDILRNGKKTNCGKNSKRKYKINYLGKKFDNYEVIERMNNNWKCKTDNGEIIYKTSTELAMAPVYKNQSQKEEKENKQNILKLKSMYNNMKRASVGEFLIMCILLQNNIFFEIEKVFTTFKSQQDGYYRFDFYVDNKYLIEFDGIQHFEENEGFFGQLENIRKSDNIKNQWCKDNNIPLIRIPYTQLNILSIKDLKPESSDFLVK